MTSHEPIEGALDLRLLVHVLWRRRMVILSAVLASALIAAGVSLYVLSPIYEARAQIFLSEQSAPAYATAESAARVLTGPAFLEPLAAKSGIGATGGRLQRLVTASAIRDTKVVDLRIRYGDPERLRVFTNAIVAEFVRLASQRVEERRKTAERRLAAVDAQLNEFARTVRATRQTLERLGTGAPQDPAAWFARSFIINSVGTSEELYAGLLKAQTDLRNEILALDPPAVIQSPYVLPEPVSPRTLLNVSVAMVLGLFAGILAAFVLETLRPPSVTPVPSEEGAIGAPSFR